MDGVAEVVDVFGGVGRTRIEVVVEEKLLEVVGHDYGML